MGNEAHVRIDEGIKRGHKNENANPRNPLGQYLPILPRADNAAIHAALTEYAEGATLDDIATKHGVSKQAIYSWLLGDLGGKEHSELVTQALTARIADADHRLDSSTTPLDLARAREQARFRRMDFERRRSHLYGQQQTSIQVNAGGPVQINVVSFYDAAPQQISSSDTNSLPNLGQDADK